MQASKITYKTNANQQAAKLVQPAPGQPIRAAEGGLNGLFQALKAADSAHHADHAADEGYFSQLIMNEEEEVANYFEPFKDAQAAKISAVSQEANVVAFEQDSAGQKFPEGTTTYFQAPMSTHLGMPILNIQYMY